MPTVTCDSCFDNDEKSIIFFKKCLFFVLILCSHIRGGFNINIRKNVSHNKYEDHIRKLERELMKKHRLGYSALHKFLILKEGQQQFSIPYFWIIMNINLKLSKIDELKLREVMKKHRRPFTTKDAQKFFLDQLNRTFIS